MKKIKSIALLLATVMLLTTTLPSCLMTKTSVGAYTESWGNDYTYAKGKQLWLFWGIIPIGRTNVNTPGDGNCQVITKFAFSDVLISALTLGIVTSYSIRVKAKRV